jgi:hypothetical protein
MFCWPCITVYQYSETNVMHFLFSLLRIKGLYMYWALLAHPQEALHKRHLVYCVCVMSVGCTRIAVELVRPTDITRTHHVGFTILIYYDARSTKHKKISRDTKMGLICECAQNLIIISTVKPTWCTSYSIYYELKGLYMFQALLAHPQEAPHKRHLVYCVRVMSVGCTRIGVEWCSQLT